MVRVSPVLFSIKALKEKIASLRIRGIEITRDPKLNKGMAFSLKERQVLGIHGLLPPAVITQDQQAYRSELNFYKSETDLDKYLYLNALQDRNEKLFYRVLRENVEDMMPIVYTPTVGLACQKWGLIYRRPRGLFITIHDRGHIHDILCNWNEPDVNAIVVTDGERILGLGDLGAYGMGIPVGKLTLYTALGGIQPHQCLPILLDAGTDNESLLQDPLYIGLRQRRVRGPEYDDFVDEFMRAAVERYGQNTLIQFEDFGNSNAYRLLNKYQHKYCCFNDDIQGTAGVALAGLWASSRVTGRKISESIIFFNGAGSAACGIANLLTEQMKLEGLSEEEATSRIYMNDADGFVVHDRPAGCQGEKARWGKKLAPETNLETMITAVEPTILIGACGVGGVFTPGILKKMGQWNERPVIFALSNPTSKAECTAEEAYKQTDGRVAFASGSPFAPVELNGHTFYPGQGNNSYIFPGVALATVAVGIRHITDKFFLIAAETCANFLSEEELNHGRLYPQLGRVRDLSLAIAVKCAHEAYESGLALWQPKPENMEEFLKSRMYNDAYDSFLPSTYDWPEGIASPEVHAHTAKNDAMKP